MLQEAQHILCPGYVTLPIIDAHPLYIVHGKYMYSVLFPEVQYVTIIHPIVTCAYERTMTKIP